MQIERTKDEILIRVSNKTDITGLRRIMDFLKFREISSQSKATDQDIDELAAESKKNWWLKNKDKFVK